MSVNKEDSKEFNNKKSEELKKKKIQDAHASEKELEKEEEIDELVVEKVRKHHPKRRNLGPSGQEWDI